MASQTRKEQFSSLLAHLHVENLPFFDAPDFSHRNAPVSEDFKLYHANFRESLRKLQKLNELGYQTIILGGILNRLELSPEILFCGGNMYSPLIQEYIKTISAPLPKLSNELEPTNQEEVFQFITAQVSSCEWFHDFLLYYTDSSLNMDISVINFEVRMDPVDSVFDHPDFFKVLIGQLAYFPFLKKKFGLHCDGFCTSSVLLAGTDLWLLHFVIKQDEENPDILKKFLYISDKYDLTLEEDAMFVECSLKWATERGLSNIEILKRNMSESNTMRISNAKLASSVGSVQVLKFKQFSLSAHNYNLNKLGEITKEEALEKFEKMYPDTDFEEKVLTFDGYADLFDHTRLVYFAVKDQFVVFENKTRNNSKFLIFDKYRVLIPKETPLQWKFVMQSEAWNAITSSNFERAFEAPLSIVESLGEDSLFIKLEDNSNPLILEKLTSIHHPNVLKVIKVIEVDNIFVATINETLCPLSSMFDRNNPHHKLEKNEIENILFCFEIIQNVWDGLRYLASHNIYYKDISFHNIMLSQELTKAKLIDFESCCDDIEKWNDLSIFTSVYTPNELYDEQSQIFSLAVLLCELVFTVLAHHNNKKDQPRSIGFDSKFKVSKISEIPSITDLKHFILKKFLRHFPQHLYYIQYFVDVCIVEKSKRASVKMFDLALSTWKKILNYEQKLKKNSYKYSILPQLEKHK